ncbi:MAG: alpha,alpha-trehalase TreF [Chitinophagales bacterium]|nr:alpha,alpha-trehalase TreF [Chitinophagales bacterium]
MRTFLHLLSLGIIFLFLPECKQNNNSDASKNANSQDIIFPNKAYGALFAAVQQAKIFPDGKTFADCTPKFSPEEILKKYEAAAQKPDFNLAAFVSEHFNTPVNPNSGYKSDLNESPEAHLSALWSVLTRQPDQQASGTLLPLPKSYIVPGGRFREIYYWDSYFTMLGLAADGRFDMIDNMLDNFAYLIDTYGHIPNGNRSYYLTRSQPPFFSLMVKLAQDNYKGAPDKAPYLRYLSQMEKEYAYWNNGSNTLGPDSIAGRRAVWMSESIVLNRYWDDEPAPRPESWREDFESAQSLQGARSPESLYRDIKAAAESGWDFSSRWGATDNLREIRTTDIIPVDLNCLMMHLENTLADAWEAQNALKYSEAGQQKAAAYRVAANQRKLVLQNLCYDASKGWFFDYNWKTGEKTGVYALSGIAALYFGVATPEQANACAKTVEKQFLRPGGLVTTPNHTGQQWDAPNGWAPLQWMGIAGLRRYQHNALAATVKQRWVDLNVKVYQRTGKMLEKYNVEDLSLEAGGGEYPVQDGFGWTNGVLLRLLKEQEQ